MPSPTPAANAWWSSAAWAVGCSTLARPAPRSFMLLNIARSVRSGATMVHQVSAGIDVGHVVAGKFELVRLLGRGSMGEVWVAHHRTLGEHVALKLLTPSAGGEVREEEATAAERFRFEAQIAARLSRKTRHIVRVTDHGDEGGLTYLVMELLEGETLDALMTRSRGRPLDVAVDVVTQIARALAQAHAEGVFHRDLKPANVFVTHDEEGRSL